MNGQMKPCIIHGQQLCANRLSYRACWPAKAPIYTCHAFIICQDNSLLCRAALFCHAAAGRQGTCGRHPPKTDPGIGNWMAAPCHTNLYGTVQLIARYGFLAVPANIVKLNHIFKGNKNRAAIVNGSPCCAVKRHDCQTADGMCCAMG